MTSKFLEKVLLSIIKLIIHYNKSNFTQLYKSDPSSDLGPRPHLRCLPPGTWNMSTLEPETHLLRTSLAFAVSSYI